MGRKVRRCDAGEAFLARGRLLLGSTALTLVLLNAPVAWPAEWRTEADIGFSTSYRTSAFRDEDDDRRGRRDEGGLIATLSPELRASLQGSRVQAALTGQVPLDFNVTNGSFRARQDLIGSANIDLWRQRFLLDLQATSRRELIDPDTRVTLDPLGDDRGRETINTVSISPSYFTRLAGLATLQLSLRQNWSFAESRGDTTNTSLFATVSTPRPAAKVTWSVTLSQNISNSSGDAGTTAPGAPPRVTELNRTDLIGNASYRITPKYGLTASLGYESIRRGSGAADTTGLTWTLGGTYTPFEDLQAQASFGERFGGSTINLSVIARLGTRFTLNASVFDSIDTRERQVGFGSIAFDFETGQFVDLISGLPVDFAEPNFGLPDEITKTRTYQLALTGAWQRTSIAMSIAALERESEFRGDSTTATATLSGSYQLDPDSQLGFTAAYRSTDDTLRFGVTAPDAVRSEQSYSVQATYSKRLGRRVTFNLNATYSDTLGSDDADTLNRSRDDTGITGGLNFQL